MQAQVLLRATGARAQKNAIGRVILHAARLRYVLSKCCDEEFSRRGCDGILLSCVLLVVTTAEVANVKPSLIRTCRATRHVKREILVT
eukprot:6197469-Pleurochrysis_carterae.AAC.3